MKIEFSLGLANILTIIFIILKLFNVIKFGWFYVFLPSILLFALPCIVLFMILLICIIFDFSNEG